MKTDQRKQSMYLEWAIIQEMRREAARLDRPISWLAQKAWNLAKDELKGRRAPPRE